MDSEVYKLTGPTPSYEVQFGYMCRERAAFTSFELALAFYRGYLQCKGHNGLRGYAHVLDDGPRLVNVDNIDGAPDASPAAQHGLTAAEWEQLENAE